MSEPSDGASAEAPHGVRTLVQEAARKLLLVHAAEDVDDARLQAELLYGEAAGLDRARVIAAGDRPADPAAIERFEAFVTRRLDHEPLAYILGRREFYGLTFEVGPGALVPRPETEGVVEVALAAIREHPRTHRLVHVADIGTGSGIIGLSIAQHAPQAQVTCVDISGEALQWAGRNMRRFGLQDRVVLLMSDLCDSLQEPVDVLCANLPYVSTEEFEALPAQIREREPRVAVEGGEMGIELIDRLAKQLPTHLAADTAAVILEMGSGQMGWVEDLVLKALREAGRGPLEARQHRDLRGIRRVLEVRVGEWPSQA
ncbi:MAG: peptide chain release factor N(5)-glutamine methyltransferase [Dehalococcoidia bacterium]|nr:peptide chain release factor N(5)-glutamine methyltransferase [Dehalococcoidia bacterium]